MVASVIWLICLVAAFGGAILRNVNAGELLPFAIVASVPAVLALAVWPWIRREGAQLLIILAWLTLAIMGCLAVGFLPMAILFMCAPAAAALFEKEKVIEAMFLAVLFAAVIYYAGVRGFLPPDMLATDLQATWSKTLAIIATFAFLIAALYGAADSARYKYPVKGHGLDAAILDAIPGGIIRVTGENNISFVTDAAHALFDLPADKSVVNVADLFSDPGERTVLLNLIERARSTRRPESRKFNFKDTGHTVHTEFTASPLAGDNVLLHITDTTAHEARVDSLHEERAAAQKETEGKTLFFAGVSHELRTPLNAIIGFSDMMRSRLFGPLPGKYAEYADLIHDSGQHMLDLIGDVLDMAKVEAGKYELVYGMFDAADVVRSSIKMIRPTADAAQVTIDAEIVEDPGELLVHADRKALRQMILNLLSNAIKFTPKGGRIVVSAKIVGNVLNITVADNGEGMSESELAQVGRPFAQTRSGKNNQERSSGLGLSLVKSLCDLHGGRFVINSRPNVGTVADIYLPQTRAED